jgi:hypothetical protein
VKDWPEVKKKAIGILKRNIFSWLMVLPEAGVDSQYFISFPKVDYCSIS